MTGKVSFPPIPRPTTTTGISPFDNTSNCLGLLEYGPKQRKLKDTHSEREREREMNEIW